MLIVMMLLAVTLVFNTPARPGPVTSPQGDSPTPRTRDNHTLLPTLSAWVDTSEAYTNEIVVVWFEGTLLAQNETGVFSLVPSNHLVNISVLDVNHNVIIKTGAVPLFVGKGSFRFPIDPLWTSTRLNVSVFDAQASLYAFVDVRTHMSDEYLLWRQEKNDLELRNEVVIPLMREAEAARSAAAWTSGGLAAMFTVLIAVIFLQIDHKRARSVNQNSIADRLRLKLFRWSLVDTFLDEYFDPESTWDPGAARGWGRHRTQAQITELRTEQDAIESEITALEESMREPTTLPLTDNEKGVAA